MAFNPIHEYSSVAGAERTERKTPCSNCKMGITITPPTNLNSPRNVSTEVCWACWAGWVGPTRHFRDFTRHPHYIKTRNLILQRQELKRARLALREEAEAAA